MEDPSQPATDYEFVDGRGRVGFINPVTQPFCRDCTRARISAEGRFYTCLFGAEGHDLRAMLRSEATDDELATAITDVWRVCTDRYSELRSAATSNLPRIEMFAMGG